MTCFKLIFNLRYFLLVTSAKQERLGWKSVLSLANGLPLTDQSERNVSLIGCLGELHIKLKTGIEAKLQEAECRLRIIC